MSSPQVRTQMIVAWPALVPTIPLVESVNDSPDIPSVTIWATFLFDVTHSGPVTMGSAPWYEEQGIAMIVLMAYSGVGDDAIAAAAETVIRAWRMWLSPDKAVWVLSADGPRPPDTETVGNYYRLSVDLKYAYSYK